MTGGLHYEILITHVITCNSLHCNKSDIILSYLTYVYIYVRGRDSSVGTTTRYGLDGPGIESRSGARFSAPVQTGPGPYPASCTMGTGSFLGVKRPGRGADYPPPSKCRGHERVGLYLYSPSGPQWLVIGRTFTFYIYIYVCMYM